MSKNESLQTKSHESFFVRKEWKILTVKGRDFFITYEIVEHTVWWHKIIYWTSYVHVICYSLKQSSLEMYVLFFYIIN